MTKMKSKKMTKSTFAIIIMGIIMVAMLAFGGTFAYFTAESQSHSTSMTTGRIQLTTGDVVTVSNKTVVDGAEILGDVSFDIGETNVKTYVFITMSSSITKSTLEGVEVEEEDLSFTDLFGKELTVLEGWNKLQDLTTGEGENQVVVGTVYYQLYDPATSDAWKQDFVQGLTLDAKPHWEEGKPMPKEMDASVTVSIKGEAIQAYKATVDGVDTFYTQQEAYNKLTETNA